MEIFDEINNLLAMTTICNKSGIVNESFSVSELTLLGVRDTLYRMGKIVNDDTDKNAYVAIVRAGLFKMDSVFLAVQLIDETLIVAAYMRRALCSKRICKGAIDEFKRELER